MSLFGGSEERTSSSEPESSSSSESEISESELAEVKVATVKPDFDEGSYLEVNNDPKKMLSDRLSSNELKRYRRYYYHDLNIVNAFETAAASDLAHNLFGFALEKRAALEKKSGSKGLSACEAPAWTSKRRRLQGSHGEAGQNHDAWTAWPVHLRHFPVRDMTFADRTSTMKDAEPFNKKQKIVHPSADLEDALITVGLKRAREQFLEHKKNDAKARKEHPDNAFKTWEADLESLAFSMDEEHCSAILTPLVKNNVATVAKLFTALKASRVMHLHQLSPLPRSGGHRTQLDLEELMSQIDSDQSAAPSDNQIISEKRQRSKIRTGKNGRFGLRDWSEVLAMASSVGWDSQALDRTMARCSELFGEAMSTQLLRYPEGLHNEEELDAIGRQNPPISIPDWNPESMQCPHQGCEWNKRKFNRLLHMITHIQSSHHWDPTPYMDLSSARAPNLAGWSLHDLRCPHTDCAWKDFTYVREDVLVQHILNFHQWDPRKQPRRAGRLMGGVHVDGFLEPIAGRMHKPRAGSTLNEPIVPRFGTIVPVTPEI